MIVKGGKEEIDEMRDCMNERQKEREKEKRIMQCTMHIVDGERDIDIERQRK